MTPFVPLAQVADINALDFSLAVNGQRRQAGNTQDLIWPIAELLAKMSHSFTLHPGDIVLTGTPKGVSALHAQDSLELTLDGQHHFSAVIAP